MSCREEEDSDRENEMTKTTSAENKRRHDMNGMGWDGGARIGIFLFAKIACNSLLKLLIFILVPLLAGLSRIIRTEFKREKNPLHICYRRIHVHI